jgi:hypothetical protein
MSVRAAFAAVLFTAGLMVAAVASAGAASADTGCPEAWTLRSVESLAATGNAPIPGQVDAAGNQDGYVCTFPLPDEACIQFIVRFGLPACPVEQLYLYMDNDLPR